ncbi:MAG: hypothetical protein JXQ91_06100, partial [Vannielia sp.]
VNFACRFTDLKILVSRQSNNFEAMAAMINPSGLLFAPERLANQPRREFIKWHRENRFKV